MREVESPASGSFGRALGTLSGVIALSARFAAPLFTAKKNQHFSTTPPHVFCFLQNGIEAQHLYLDSAEPRAYFFFLGSRTGAGVGWQAVELLIVSMFTSSWVKQRRLRRIPKPAAGRPIGGRSCRCPHLVFLVLVLVLLLQLPGSRIDGAVAGEETLSSRSRRFRDPRATFYDLLGVSRHSSQKEIKRMFRKLAIQMHPDKLGPFENEAAEAEANAIFIKVRPLHLVWCVYDSSPEPCAGLPYCKLALAMAFPTRHRCVYAASASLVVMWTTVSVPSVFFFRKVHVVIKHECTSAACTCSKKKPNHSLGKSKISIS